MVAVVVLAGLVLGCGGEEQQAPERPDRDEPFLSLSEVASVLEAAELAPVDGDEQRQEVVDAARFGNESGRHFEVLVFASERAARQALPSIADREQAVAAVRAANVVALFPQDYRDVEAYQAPATAIQRLNTACSTASGQQRLRRLCFDDDGVRPSGEGVDRDEAEEAEDSISVGGLRYNAVLARILNPHIRPDQQLVSRQRPDEGKIWFGVFLRVCNDSDEARTPSANLALVDAFGDRVEPYDELPASNAFAYEPRPVPPDSCLPREGSLPARVIDGALVLFETSSDFLGNFPLALEVAGRDGQRERVVVNF